MKVYAMGILSALTVALGMNGTGVAGQVGNTAASHIASAKVAAGTTHVGLFNRLCTPIADPPSGQRPPRSEWHAEPVKVFDNLYFLGMTEYSAWAVTTSAGIVILDALFDYSVEDEIVNGLKQLRLDPSQIKYVLVSHGHTDHAGGASYLQQHFGAHVLLSAADWDLLATDTGSWPKPKRDMVVVDGQRLTLGDTTLTFYITPGHTPGTISTIFPVQDGGKPHIVAEWGGTAFNWMRPSQRARYIAPERPEKFWFDSYSSSARRFRDVVSRAGADVIISNHSNVDGSQTKLPALAKRKPGDSHPYVIGNDAVKRYLTVADECAQAASLGYGQSAGALR
jgi:metallo-beta-lactamase class B